MSLQDLLYSRRLRHRLVRHLSLWGLYAVYFTAQGYFPTEPTNGISLHFLRVALLSTALFFPYCFLSAYVLMYYLYPRYLQKGRYFTFLLLVGALALAGLFINYWAGVVFFRYSGRYPYPGNEDFFLGMHNVTIAIIISAFILGLRMGRDAYSQQRANLLLAAQKARAELRLLKTRIDPGFLFSTLDRLRAEIDAGSPGAPAALLQLSDTLSDILYEGEGGLDLTAADDPQRYYDTFRVEAPGFQPPTSGISLLVYEFIFSKRPRVRYARHLAFWLLRLCYLDFVFHIRAYWPSHPPSLSWATSLQASLVELAGEMVLTYGIAYWLFDRFFERRKYFSFFLSSLLLLFTVFVVTYRDQLNFHYSLHEITTYGIFWNSLMNFTRLGFTTWLLFIAARLFKAHFQRMRERETLSKETANIGYQLLKAQVHPHFLFNTLNNIYSFALDGSPRAAQLLAQLADLMKYMIYDCQADRMPLDRELKMLKDYIGLERARYGDRLDIEVEINGSTGRLRIAPLLMIPFVENCFKHGTSQVLQRPWVRMRICADENGLDFRLSNSKPPPAMSANGTGGIGLKNIRQRLELLYGGQYRLDIVTSDDTWSVHMLVPLEGEKR
jgi:sensor histidine kinase YesM